MKQHIISRLYLNREGVVRMAADAIMVNVSLLAALVLRYLWLVGAQGSEDAANMTFQYYLSVYVSSFWLLTLICLSMFFLSGFYSRGRRYRSRYKVLIIIQAVTLSYLLFGFLAYFAPKVFGLPRAVLMIAWALTFVVLATARLWAAVWAGVIKSETLHTRRLEERKIRNVLVIGGAGYIGSALLPKLLDKGYRVRLLDLLLYGDEPIRSWIGHPRVEIIRADFRHIDKVVEAMNGMDAVIHLGAIVGDPACALDESLTISVNLMATRMIAEVAKGSGVDRFIFASTCSVYGASDQLLNERSALNPVSLYARSKIASERVLQKMADEHFAPVILRFGTVFGLSGRTRFDLVINLLTAKALMEKRITVYGGDQWRPFVHVDDAALSLLKALEAPRVAVQNEIFNVGSDDQNFTIAQVGEIIQQLVPEAELVDLGADGDRRNYRVSFAKIREELNFESQWTVTQGALQVVDAIRGGRVKDYQEPQYSNVKFLSEEGIARLANYDDGWVHELLNDTGSTIVIDTKIGQFPAFAAAS